MTTSANNITITPSFVTDASGGQWSITPSPTALAQVCHNGVVDTTTANVTMLLYHSSIVYHENTAGDFYGFENSAWTLSPGDPRQIVLVESSNGTTVSTIGPAIVDAALEKWTLVASVATGNQIALNGTIIAASNNVTLLVYENHLLYQENSGGGWWYYTASNASWTATSDPRTTTPTTSPTSSISPPPQAVGAGYTTLAFDDEFTSDSISYNGSYSGSGTPKWYTCTASTTTSQLYISNGVCNFLKPPLNNGANIQTDPNPYSSTAAQSTPSSIKQGSGQGVNFTYGYFEASMAFPASGATDGIGWPTFFMTNTYVPGTAAVVFPHNEIDILEYQPVNGGGSTGPGNITSTVHQWLSSGAPGNGNTQITKPGGFNSANYNTYGCLWTPTTITFYLNNVASVMPNGQNPVHLAGTFTGSIAPFPSGVLGDNVVLGTSSVGWPMTVDWVRIWQ
jgi:hypothetical protein